MSEIDTLRKKAKECHESCSDYSCVRRGYCAGSAGHKLDDFRRKQEQQREEQRKEEHEYQVFKKRMDRYLAAMAKRPEGGA